MQKILVVEDDKYLNKLLCDRFVLEGFDVASCQDGDTALKKLEEARLTEAPFTILLCDMLLPRMMGAEVFTRLREVDHYKDLRVFAMSGIYKDEQMIQDLSMLHSLDAYLTKPFDIDKFIESLTGNPLKHVQPQETSGTINSTSMERLYFRAYDRGFTGKLILRVGDSERRVYFSNGFPVAAESTVVSESLGTSLVQLGIITQSVRETASELMVKDGIQFGRALIQLGAMTESQLFDALRKHTYRILLNTFTAKEGEYEFIEMTTLPQHVMILEFNPILIVLKAQTLLYKKEFIRSLYETKRTSFAHRTARFFQVVPMFNLEPQSTKLLLEFSNSECLDDLLKRIPEMAHDTLLRVFYTLESFQLLEWKASPSTQQQEVSSLDLKTTLDPEAGSEEIAKKIQSRYVKTLAQNFFEILEITPESSDIEINASYREIRYQLHPDRFGDQLNAQTKRILDDMLARIDKAYQTVTQPDLREEYLAATKQSKDDSLADSKRYLDAQNYFREGLNKLSAQDFATALEKFQQAAKLWSRGVEYESYAAYAAFKLTLSSKNEIEAQKLVNKLKDIAFKQATSDTCFLLLGHAYKALGKAQQSKEAYLKALQCNEKCDDAANALAGMGDEQFKKAKIKQTVQASKHALKFAFILGLVISAAAGGYWIYLKRQDEAAGIKMLEPKDFHDILPARLVRTKEDTAKITAQAGWFKTVPETVMKSKCQELVRKGQTYGIMKFYIYDEETGLKAYCTPTRYKSY